MQRMGHTRPSPYRDEPGNPDFAVTARRRRARQARESLPGTPVWSAIIRAMSLAELLSGRTGLAGRLPQRLEELRGPAKGVVVLPRHLSWPGMREFDVTDDSIRRSMYGIVLTQGRRNDVLRFLNARLLTEDWPLIRSSLDPKLRRWCERRFALHGSPEARETQG